MEEQLAYDLAEWLLHNADALKEKLSQSLARWKNARDTLSGNEPAYIMKYNKDIKAKYTAAIYEEAFQHFKGNSYLELEIAFDDERVQIIYNKYYMEDL